MRKASYATWPAPIKGLLKAGPLVGAPKDAAEVLENFIPTARGARLRGGSTLFATVAGPVIQLMNYRSGTSENLFAATATDIYDVSAVADPLVSPAASVSRGSGGVGAEPLPILSPRIRSRLPFGQVKDVDNLRLTYSAHFWDDVLSGPKVSPKIDRAGVAFRCASHNQAATYRNRIIKDCGKAVPCQPMALDRCSAHLDDPGFRRPIMVDYTRNQFPTQ